VNKGRISIERAAALCSFNTARAFGLAPRKGMIAVGSDADFTLVDLAREQRVTPSLLQSAADFSLYDGWTLKGWPVLTAVRGTIVFDSGRIIAKPGFAQHVGRTP
jgi:dihydropyrimidinase